jgi:uncharacterized membrane protein YccF (DUF307 family)
MNTNSVVIEQRQSPGCLLQLLWFALVGWWLGELWIVAAWISMEIGRASCRERV